MFISSSFLPSRSGTAAEAAALLLLLLFPSLSSTQQQQQQQRSGKCGTNERQQEGEFLKRSDINVRESRIYQYQRQRRLSIQGG